MFVVEGVTDYASNACPLIVLCHKNTLVIRELGVLIEIELSEFFWAQA